MTEDLKYILQHCVLLLPSENMYNSIGGCNGHVMSCRGTDRLPEWVGPVVCVYAKFKTTVKLFAF